MQISLYITNKKMPDLKLDLTGDFHKAIPKIIEIYCNNSNKEDNESF
jgi:hypothetical protein